MPRKNGITSPRLYSVASEIWQEFDKNGAPVTTEDGIAFAEKHGFNHGNVMREYWSWKTYHGK